MEGSIKTLVVMAALFGFLSAPMAEVIFQDDFESGDLSTTANGFTWAYSRKTLVDNTRAKTGTHSLHYPYPGDGANNPESPDSFVEQRFMLGKRCSELWFKFDIYFPANYTHRSVSPNNNKFLILWSGDYSGRHFIDIESWVPRDAEFGGSGSSNLVLGMKYNGRYYGNDHAGENLFGQASDVGSCFRSPDDAGKWHEFVYHVKLESGPDAKDGVIELWKDRVKEMEYLHLKNYDTQENYLDKGYLLGWSNTGFAGMTHIYIDDFVLSSTRFDFLPADASVEFSILSSALPEGREGATYGQTIAVNGGTAPYQWSMVAGNLPTGLSFSATAGRIFGVPKTAGKYSFTLQVTDAYDAKVTGAFSINVVPAAALAVNPRAVQARAGQQPRIVMGVGRCVESLRQKYSIAGKRLPARTAQSRNANPVVISAQR